MVLVLPQRPEDELDLALLDEGRLVLGGVGLEVPQERDELAEVVRAAPAARAAGGGAGLLLEARPAADADRDVAVRRVLLAGAAGEAEAPDVGRHESDRDVRRAREDVGAVNLVAHNLAVLAHGPIVPLEDVPHVEVRHAARLRCWRGGGQRSSPFREARTAWSAAVMHDAARRTRRAQRTPRACASRRVRRLPVHPPRIRTRPNVANSTTGRGRTPRSRTWCRCPWLRVQGDPSQPR